MHWMVVPLKKRCCWVNLHDYISIKLLPGNMPCTYIVNIYMISLYATCIKKGKLFPISLQHQNPIAAAAACAWKICQRCSHRPMQVYIGIYIIYIHKNLMIERESFLVHIPLNIGCSLYYKLSICHIHDVSRTNHSYIMDMYI